MLLCNLAGPVAAYCSATWLDLFSLTALFLLAALDPVLNSVAACCSVIKLDMLPTAALLPG
jgi:hypothetical protein